MSAESGSVTRHADHFYTSEREVDQAIPPWRNIEPVEETGRRCDALDALKRLQAESRQCLHPSQ